MLLDRLHTAFAGPHSPIGDFHVVLALTKLQRAYNEANTYVIWRRSMEYASTSQCHDLRDKVYGVQSLLPPTFRVQVDYTKTPIEVFLDTTRTMSLIGKQTSVRAFDFAEALDNLVGAMRIHRSDDLFRPSAGVAKKLWQLSSIPGTEIQMRELLTRHVSELPWPEPPEE
jgi:hypothetical protein